MKDMMLYAKLLELGKISRREFRGRPNDVYPRNR